jgi:uncharacterized protein (DUF1778 family)
MKVSGAARRTERLNLRLTPDELAQIRLGAEARKMTVSAFMIDSALSSVRQAVTDERRTLVSRAVLDRLLEEMDQPGQVVDSLAELLKRPPRVELPE